MELPLTLTDTTVLFKLPTTADIERAHERAVSHSWEWYALRSMIGQEVSHVDRGAGVVLEVTQDERIAIRFYKKGKDGKDVHRYGENSLHKLTWAAKSGVVHVEQESVVKLQAISKGRLSRQSTARLAKASSPGPSKASSGPPPPPPGADLDLYRDPRKNETHDARDAYAAAKLQETTQGEQEGSTPVCLLWLLWLLWLLLALREACSACARLGSPSRAPVPAG